MRKIELCGWRRRWLCERAHYLSICEAIFLVEPQRTPQVRCFIRSLQGGSANLHHTANSWQSAQLGKYCSTRVTIACYIYTHTRVLLVHMTQQRAGVLPITWYVSRDPRNFIFAGSQIYRAYIVGLWKYRLSDLSKHVSYWKNESSFLILLLNDEREECKGC